jgi:hypothetical protein
LLSFGGDGEEIVDLPLPAFAHVAVGHLIARQDEGGVHKANARAASFPGKGEGDEGIERRLLADIAFMAAPPGIDEALVRGDL